MIQTSFAVTSEAELNAAIAAINVGGASSAANTSYTITITFDFILNADIDAINLAAGDTLTIQGSNPANDSSTAQIDGDTTYRGFVVTTGSVNLNNLSLTGMTAPGGTPAIRPGAARVPYVGAVIGRDQCGHVQWGFCKGRHRGRWSHLRRTGRRSRCHGGIGLRERSRSRKRHIHPGQRQHHARQHHSHGGDRRRSPVQASVPAPVRLSSRERSLAARPIPTPAERKSAMRRPPVRFHCWRRARPEPARSAW